MQKIHQLRAHNFFLAHKEKKNIFITFHEK